MGGIILSLDGYQTYLTERAELWERQALIKARFSAGDAQVADRFFELIRPFVFRPGLDPDIVAAVRGMKRQIDRSLSGKGVERRHVKLGRGGIREVEFLVQALQLLYSGDDPWLRERNSLRAIFRLTERGYLSQSSTGCKSSTSSRLIRFPRTPWRWAGWPGGSAPRCRPRRPAAPSRPSTGGSPTACTRPSPTSLPRRPSRRRRPLAYRRIRRSRPPASSIPTARARTCDSSSRGALSSPTSSPCAGPSGPCSPCSSTPSGRAPIRMRRSTSSSASSPRRDRAPRISSSSPIVPTCSRTSSSSALAASS